MPTYKKVSTTPMWLPTNQLPSATAAGGCMTTANDGSGQFRYDLLN